MAIGGPKRDEDYGRNSKIHKVVSLINSKLLKQLKPPSQATLGFPLLFCHRKTKELPVKEVNLNIDIAIVDRQF